MEQIFTREQFNNFISPQTKKYQKIYGFEIEPQKGIHDTHNNESDAFKHTFMSADLSVTYGNSISKGLGDWHEYVEGKNSPKDEFDMDL